MKPLDTYNFDAHIHLYKWKDFNILLDVNSGAIHVLDELSNKLLKNIIAYKGNVHRAIEDTKKDFSDEEVLEAVSEIEKANAAGALFSEPEIPEVDLSKMNVKAICLNVAHACNMKCDYCFAAQGDFGMKQCLMSIDVGKQAMDFLLENSGDIRNLEVDFFGGEPLLVVPMLKKLVKYCREKEKETGKRFNFTLTTNCVLLDDDIANWVIENDISVILSLDGRPEVNDRHRVLNNGEGTYDIIVPHIQKMVARKPVSYFVRGTFTRKNLDFAKDLEHFIELGFDCVSVEPAVGPKNGYSIEEEDLPLVLSEYEHLTDVLLDNYSTGSEIDFFHYNLNLQSGPCLAKRISGCGAGIEYLVITPEGDIYPCHQFVGTTGFLMGNIFDGIANSEIRKKFENNQLKDKECRDCWARYFCGGGCHANAYLTNGDMKQPHKVSCVMHKKRVEGAIYVDLNKQIKRNTLRGLPVLPRTNDNHDNL